MHDFGEKVEIFSSFVFIKNRSRKLFGDVLDKRQPLKTIKTSVYEKRKIRMFSNGLVHDFGEKVEIFSSFVFIKNRSRKSVC